MMASYVLWYRTKKLRQLLDYLKLGWVLCACATVMVSVAFHGLSKPFSAVTEALFWAMALLFVCQRWVQRRDQAAR